MSRFTHNLATGKSTRFHKIEFLIVVDDRGQITIAMRHGEELLRTGLTQGEAMNLAAILETAARVADR
jgi:hypothetical protein